MISFFLLKPLPQALKHLCKYLILAIFYHVIFVLDTLYYQVFYFSCVFFENNRNKKYFTPTQEYAELFLKIQGFLEAHYSNLAENLRSEYFSKEITEESWIQFLSDHAPEDTSKKWANSKFSHDDMRGIQEKLQKEWSKHMEHVSPKKVITIEIKGGECR